MAAQGMELIRISRLFTGAEAVLHIAYFRPSRAGYQDRISRSILDFNEGKNPQSSRWIELSAGLVCKTIEPDLVIRRLDPSETVADAVRPLDLLGEAIANACECLYDRTRLHKAEAGTPDGDAPEGGSRQAQQAESFRFDGAGLAEDVRVLIVDDIIGSGTVLEAITCAVKRELPRAEIYCFGLARADSSVANTHLDPEYFFADTAPESAFSNIATRAKPRRPKSDDTVRVIVPKQLRAPQALAATGKLGRFKVAVLGVLGILLLVGALAPLRTSKDALASPEAITVGEPIAVTDPVADNMEALPRNNPPPPRVVKPSSGPVAVVTVPSAGLRASHAMTSKVIPKSSLKNGEKVALLGRHAPGDGPSWVQVRTQNGKTGWMLASLVHIKRM